MDLSKTIIAFIILFITSFSAQSQDDNKLYMKSSFWGNKFFKGDTIISVNQVLYEMAPNESVYTLMKSAKTDFVFAQILGATGGIMLGWEVGTAIGGGDPNWAIAGVGGGLIGISIPISINFRKKANAAILEHNKLIAASNKPSYKPAYNLGFDGKNIKFLYRF